MPERLDGLLDDAFDRLDTQQVRLDMHVFAAGRLDGCSRFRCVGGIGHADDVRARLRQCHRHTAAKAPFRTGDDGHFSIQLECVENSAHCVLLT